MLKNILVGWNNDHVENRLGYVMHTQYMSPTELWYGIGQAWNFYRWNRFLAQVRHHEYLTIN